MNELRRKKLESRILRALAEHIQKRRTKDERIGFVSIARVKLLPDLSRATIFLSLFDPDKRANAATLKSLRHNAGFFQSTIAASCICVRHRSSCSRSTSRSKKATACWTC